jgi:predicted extracellular nuclease
MKFSDSISAQTTTRPITRFTSARPGIRLAALLTALAFAGSVQSIKASYEHFSRSVVKTVLFILWLGAAMPALASDLVITGVVDGPLSGGVPKAIELCVLSDIADLSDYGVGSANNGGGSDGEEFTFPAIAVSAGTFLYVASEATGFSTFFGFAPGFVSNAASINGDDAIELFQSGAVVDIYGDINVDGTGQPWEYMDGWAYRDDGTGPDGTVFVPANWAYSGPNALDGETTNGTAATPFPIGAYSSCELPVPAPDLLLSEVVVTPTIGEFIEILNPTGSSIDLSDVYLTDATFAGGSVFYYNIVTGAGAGGGGFSDFHARFPDGASIAPGEFQTVSLAGSDDFFTAYGFDPTYELFEDGVGADAVPDMREALAGSINNQGGLSNGGEVVILYTWDGASDLVQDIDYALWGDKDEAVDKTGIAIDGPDADAVVSVYLNDTAIPIQDVVSGGSHAIGDSFQRVDFTEGVETQSGGNGLTGSDETSEDLSVTWGLAGATPGTAPAADWIINEIHADPASGLAGDANGDGVRNFSDDEFVEIVNASGAAVDISGWTLSDSSGVTHNFPAGTVIPDQCGFVVFGGGTPAGRFGFGLVQTASEGSVSLSNSGDRVTLNNGSADVATYSYGPEGGDNQSLTRDPDVTGASLIKHSLATGSGGALFSPGTMVDGDQFPGCVPDVLIHDVQGSGDTSPLVGYTVAVEGIVVGDFQDGASGTHGDLNGFHVQEEDADADGDSATSEGIFVFDGSSPATNVAVGDLVRVVGKVSEFNGLTEITSFSGVTVLSAGNPLPTPASVTLPVASLSDFEALEGMSVVLSQNLSIAEYFNFDRYGEIVLTTDRLFQPTAIHDPGSPQAAALADLNARSQITLDDGRTASNPDPALHPNGSVFDMDNLFRGGDLVQNATGVMDYTRSRYRIQPTQGAIYTPVNLRTAAHEPVGDGLKVASFNVLNYFTTLDDGPNACGPLLDQGCRGADNETEFTRQRDKIIAALSAIDADVVGLMEIENNINDDAVIDLVAGLNDANGAGTYDHVATGVIGTDVIKVALIYQPATVSLQGGHAILDSTVDPLFNDAKNRPVLAQTFVETATGGVLTVAVNHFKSKGSPCDDVGDPDTGDGSGRCNLTRKDAAEALANWLASDPTGSDDADSLVIGDLNSYDKEDPIDVLTASGYTDLSAIFGGEYAYSYVFGGQLGYLDYALASPGLFDQTTGATEWHINADEPDLLDYDTRFKKAAQVAIYAPDAYRASDHDPVIAGFDLMHYEFKGFSKPVKNPPEINSKKKAGSPLKFKFELKGPDSVDAVADGYPRSQPVACDDWSSTGPSEAIVTDGKDKMKAHKKSVRYEYKWLTDSAWKGSCRQLVVLLKDGSYHYANFKFK